MQANNDASLGWDQLSIVADEKDASLIAEALIAMGALGLSVEDDETKSIPEKPVSDTKRSRIIASFNASVEGTLQVQSAINSLLDEHGLLASAQCEWTHIPQQDYAKQFQQSWKAFEAADKLWIVPSWEENDFKTKHPDDLVILMDPELAFGTGQHETTRLCCTAILNAVRAQPRGSVRVLDVGTGTGILAMAGVLAGAAQAVGTDNDPEALMVAKANLIKNHLDDRIALSGKEPDALGEQFEIVVANILAFPLITLAPRIMAAIKPKGQLFLSGLLVNQVDEVTKAYKQLGLVDEQVTTLGEWALVHLKRR